DPRSHGVHHADADAEADQDESCVRIFTVDTAHFFFEVCSVEDLAVIGLAETELLDVVAQPGQLAVVHRIEAVDQENVNMITATFRQALTGAGPVGSRSYCFARDLLAGRAFGYGQDE